MLINKGPSVDPRSLPAVTFFPISKGFVYVTALVAISRRNF